MKQLLTTIIPCNSHSGAPRNHVLLLLLKSSVYEQEVPPPTGALRSPLTELPVTDPWFSAITVGKMLLSGNKSAPPQHFTGNHIPASSQLFASSRWSRLLLHRLSGHRDVSQHFMERLQERVNVIPSQVPTSSVGHYRVIIPRMFYSLRPRTKPLRRRTLNIRNVGPGKPAETGNPSGLRHCGASWMTQQAGAPSHRDSQLLFFIFNRNKKDDPVQVFLSQFFMNSKGKVSTPQLQPLSA